MAGREVKVESVFVTDPATLEVHRFVRGDTVPKDVQVGDHVFTEPASDEGNVVAGPTGAYHPASGSMAGTPPEPGGDGVEAPARSATRGEWEAYAVALGMSEADAADYPNKDELVAAAEALAGS